MIIYADFLKICSSFLKNLLKVVLLKFSNYCYMVLPCRSISYMLLIKVGLEGWARGIVTLRPTIYTSKVQNNIISEHGFLVNLIVQLL